MIDFKIRKIKDTNLKNIELIFNSQIIDLGFCNQSNVKELINDLFRAIVDLIE